MAPDLSRIVTTSNIAENPEEQPVSFLYYHRHIHYHMPGTYSYLDIPVKLTNPEALNRTFRDSLSHPQLLNIKIRGFL